MERMQRWREPAVVVVTGALLLRLVLALVFAGRAAALGLSAPADAAYLASRQLSEPLAFVVLALLVASCHARPPTRHARAVTALALVVAGLSLLLAVVLGLSGYRAYTPPFSQLDLAQRLVDLVLPLVAVAALVALVRRPAAAAPEPAAPALPAAEPHDAAEVTAEPAPDPQLEPTWQPDAAAGAAWFTAGDAASGRPAAGWGSPESPSGWQPARPLPASPTEPATPSADGLRPGARGRAARVADGPVLAGFPRPRAGLPLSGPHLTNPH